jgi:hypothetical protein
MTPPNAAGNAKRRRVGGGAAIVEPALRLEQTDDLRHEEGVALGARVQLADQLLRRGPSGRQPHEGRDLGPVETAEAGAAHRRLAREIGQKSLERLPRTGLGVAIRRGGRDRYIVQLPRDEAEQQRRLVGRVDVIEQQSQRPELSAGAHETRDGVEHPKASGLRVADGGLRQAWDPLAQLGQQLGELRGTGPQLGPSS